MKLARLAIVIGLSIAMAPLSTALAAPGTSGPKLETATAQYEVRFLQGMIDHNWLSVLEAQVCADNAQHPELIALCRDIVTGQTLQVARMQTWLADWYAINYEPKTTPGLQSKIDRLAAMQGADFEAAFLEDVARHHQMAIMDADKCVERVFHPELTTFCDKMAETETQQIVMMQTWQCQWYQSCKQAMPLE